MNLSQRAAYIRVSATLPAAIFFRTDLLFPRLSMPELGPFNGQLRRQEIIRELLAEISFDEIVETGSFRSTTTRFLSDISGLPVQHEERAPPRFAWCWPPRRRTAGVRAL